MNFKELINTIIYAVFPNRCVGCGEILDEGVSLCDYCFEMLPRTAEHRLCKVCGLRPDECQCKHRVFHFERCIAPFYNEGTAKTAMYGFKFNRKVYNADFFAQQMALSVKTVFHDIKFDTLCYVPMTAQKLSKRGFNQSRELAVRLADILSLPIAENALGCKNHKIQHEASYKQRFENIKGVYYTNYNLVGKTVLLVDDIKTSGATLDECARQLVRSGAFKVYCVTGLTTRKKGKKRNGN